MHLTHKLPPLLLITLLATPACIFIDAPGSADTPPSSPDMGVEADQHNPPDLPQSQEEMGDDMVVAPVDSGDDMMTEPDQGGFDMQDPDQDTDQDDRCGPNTCAPGFYCEAGCCLCTADSLCGADQACRNGECISVACRPDITDSCPTGQECGADYTCRPQTCSDDRGCPAGFICEDSACTQGCASDAECGSNEACVIGRCVDLLTNTQHCGAAGNMCASGSQCAHGRCVCQDSASNALSQSVHFISPSARTPENIWPGAAVFTYRSAEVFDCMPRVADLALCPRGQLIFKREYPLTAPHFVVLTHTNQNQLKLTAYNGLGAPAQTANGDLIRAEYLGVASEGERRILSYQMVPIDHERSKLFVLWYATPSSHAPDTLPHATRLYSYTVSGTSTAPLQITRDEHNGNPIMWGSGQDIDFAIAQTTLSSELIVATMFSAPESIHSGPHTVSLSIRDLQTGAPARNYTVNTGKSYQFARGITLDVEGTHLAMLTLEAQGASGLVNPPATTAFYNLRTYTIALNTSNRVELAPARQRTTLALQQAPVVNTASIPYLDARDSHPPVPHSRYSATAQEDVALLWERTRESTDMTRAQRVTASDMLPSTPAMPPHTLYTVPQGNPFRTAHDGVFMWRGGQSFAVWIEGETPVFPDTTGQLLFAPLQLMSMTPSSFQVPVRAIDAPWAVRRLSLARSAHATALVASGQSEAKLYLIANDRPVCQN